jgi:hypothetical protein
VANRACDLPIGASLDCAKGERFRGHLSTTAADYCGRS